jgi:hypothetical protein
MAGNCEKNAVRLPPLSARTPLPGYALPKITWRMLCYQDTHRYQLRTTTLVSAHYQESATVWYAALLCGTDVHLWYAERPRSYLLRYARLLVCRVLR